MQAGNYATITIDPLVMHDRAMDGGKVDSRAQERIRVDINNI